MGDQAKYSDDISALWGAEDTGVLEPAPVGRTEKASTSRTNGRADTEERLVRLEAHLGAVVKAVDALRGEVLGQLDLGLASAERRTADALNLVTTRLADTERDLDDRLTRLTTLVGSRQPPGDRDEEFARELLAVRAAAEQDAGRRVAELEARLHGRLEELASRAPAPDASERLGALECRTALLAEAIEAYRREAVREPHLDAVRADLQAAADEIAARTDDHLSQRLHELGGHLTHTTTSQLAGLARHDERLDEELERLRAETARTVNAQLADFRAELRAELAAELRTALRAELAALAHAAAQAHAGTTGEAEAEAERRRLEASWQQSMPGF